MPPKQQQGSCDWGDTSVPPQERLKRVANAVAAGLLVEGALAERVRQEIIFGHAAPQGTAAPLETEERYRERQAMELTKSYIGTESAPWLCRDILDAMLATPDSVLESDLKHLTASSRDRRMIVDLFRSAGPGVTPTCLLSASSPEDIAQLRRIALCACRELLRRIAAAYGASLAARGRQLSPQDRKRVREELYKSMEDDEATKQGQLVISVTTKAMQAEQALMGKLNKTNTPSSQPKPRHPQQHVRKNSGAATQGPKDKATGKQPPRPGSSQ